MKAVVIGGTGHIGTYLIPLLVARGWDVTCVSRGRREAYKENPLWARVTRIPVDRKAEESSGTFGKKIAALKPDLVIDMICFSETEARPLVDALRGSVQMYIAIGTVWIHGHSVAVPTLEDENWNAFGDYGLGKLGLLRYLLRESRCNGFPAAVIHPGHIVGPGWDPINPLGNFNPLIFSRLARGETLQYPTLGLETVHHVHASDVAAMILLAIDNWAAAAGNHFHALSAAAVTLRGYAETVSGWFGRTARLEFMCGDSWKEGLSETDIQKSWDHIERSPNGSIEKAKRLLGYSPRYSSFDALREALDWMISHNIVVP